MKQTGYSLVP